MAKPDRHYVQKLCMVAKSMFGYVPTCAFVTNGSRLLSPRYRTLFCWLYVMPTNDTRTLTSIFIVLTLVFLIDHDWLHPFLGLAVK
jgi:hypothetical protein